MKITDLGYRYPKKELPTINDISLDLPEGKIIGLFGPNGSGKTTFLKCLAGILKYDGIVEIDNGDIKNLNVLNKAKIISYVPQELELNMPFSVRDVVMMGRNPHRTGIYYSYEDKKQTDDVIKDLNLCELSNEFFTELSGGQKQLVSVARAVNQRSKYLLFDEPVSNLDYANSHRIWSLLKNLNTRGFTVVVSSHDPNHVLRYCDVVVLMSDGKIIAYGPPSEIITSKNMETLFGTPVVVGKIGEYIVVMPE